MARSNNTARASKNAWTADRKSARNIKANETRAARKNERRDIQRSMSGVTFGSFGEHYEDGMGFKDGIGF